MLPKLLQTRIGTFFPSDADAILAGFQVERTASFRINTLRTDEKTCVAAIAAAGFSIRPFPGIPAAYSLPRTEEYRFKGSEFFRSGLVYMQSFASMLSALVLAPERGESVLDVCAAPGSKTTQVAAMMGDSGRIIALEKSPVRHDVLAHNIRLQNAKSIETVRQDALNYLRENEDTFDAILLDVPCSAEGRIRMDDERTYAFFSLDNIRRKARLQSELLEASYARLAPGGTLVYSTCTLAPEENEGVVESFLANHADAGLATVEFDFPEYRPGLERAGKHEFGSELAKTARILPSDRFEGFFIAKIRRNG